MSSYLNSLQHKNPTWSTLVGLHQKVSCLCLLDLSAAFDTIDHNILISKSLPSYLGLVFMALFSAGSSLICHLGPRSFRVKCDDNLSSFHTSSCGVPQGSVLGPLLFVMYTTPLSTLISFLSLDHRLYADDSQFFFTFHPLNFDSCISHLQNALQHISSWMTANFLTLKSSIMHALVLLWPLNSCSSDAKK